MKFLKNIFTFFILNTLIGFLASPLFATHSQGGLIYINSASIGNCSAISYHCEKVDDENFVCEKNTNYRTNHVTQCREIPTNNISQIGSTHGYYLLPEITLNPLSLGENYSDPDFFLYPFVRIIKIQV